MMDVSSTTMAEEGVFIPGTVTLVDVRGDMHIKHAAGSKQDIVLVPTPSNDPNDPLNWSRRRKFLSILSASVYTFIVGLTSAAIYSVLEPISSATSLSLGDLNAGTGYMFLFFGWSCLFWQPLALHYGKRPVYLISLLGTMGTQIWAPYTTSNGQWIANKILQGFFGGPVESLVEISITDIYFTHERGRYIALYGLCLAGSSFFAPIISGFIANNMGWQWVLYWCAIFSAIGFVFLFFFLEETNYHRTPAVVHAETTTPETGSDNGNEKKVPEQSTSTEEGQIYGKPRSFLNRMKFFQPGAFSRPNQLWGMVTRPLIFLTFPVILFSGFNYGSSLVWFNVLNATASLILSAPPYSFSSSLVGVAYVAPLLGVFIAFIYTGAFGDWFLIKMARRNNGVMESEHRLWVLTASIILVPFGLLLWGVGADHSIHWFGLVFAMGIIAFTNTVGLQASVAYCIDSYRDLSGEAVVTVILVRNTMSFAINYGITPWVTNMGLQNAFIVAACVGTLQVLTFLIFVRWGKKMRKASVDRYWKYVKEVEKAGLVH